MSEIEEIAGGLDGAGKRFGVVASRFNGRIADRLVAGALDCLLRHGVETGAVRVVRVPGAWEIPGALDELARAGEVDALIALGVVIRGETPHFDVIAGGAARGIARAAREHRLPVGFGLLTCDTSEQAEERAGGKAGDKGWEAALAALEMADLYARLRETR
jgi:6,7-dimethyl-8-ribityllumazine synthase